MTPLHADIIRTIEQHGPITSEDIADRLTVLGYGGGTCFDEFKRQVSKIASKMKQSGKVIGDDIPLPGAKPMRVYRMVETEEMASDVAEVELVETLDSLDTEREIQERQAVAETLTPEPVSVEVKVEHKPRLSAEQLIQGYKDAGSQGNMLVFAAGVAFAEKHHGISQ